MCSENKATCYGIHHVESDIHFKRREHEKVLSASLLNST